MNELISALVSVAISNLHLKALQAHEACFLNGRCLYHWNTAKCEQTMDLCNRAQAQLYKE